ncbi:sigma-70 family RNA polymerase sigma factor [Clostridium perfringens]|nr:sigma-70 family RNA polymerase sigma factor [Clostridium perfringens]MBI5978100.1 sigma-70 family RNA polymerase sigma factor [Clostridium perfringens]MBI5980972.1 sigma-70 family RNA polymerase sigma factor [Clostridium perfringens]MBI5983381.1 sigma-70 family RNA polymerase sigma factor [Clostridium perfringens]MBI5986598.1 sigma-70 family RNA polymerase sigma factor [Clostridium perfringens]MBI5989859.1 sigma-70 family RNA polymerase sigma factor [Clostridium perfringens]
MVSQAKKGDKDAFLSLIDENRLSIYRVARGILNNKEDIEDALQNTIIKSYEKIGTLKKDEFFKTWIIRILINECNLILRRNKKTIFLDKLENEESYSDDYGNIELTSVVNSLSEDLRITTVLYYFEDMSTKEISEMLNIAEGTVRSRLARAREKLRDFI